MKKFRKEVKASIVETQGVSNKVAKNTAKTIVTALELLHDDVVSKGTKFKVKTVTNELSTLLAENNITTLCGLWLKAVVKAYKEEFVTNTCNVEKKELKPLVGLLVAGGFTIQDVRDELQAKGLMDIPAVKSAATHLLGAIDLDHPKANILLVNYTEQLCTTISVILEEIEKRKADVCTTPCETAKAIKEEHIVDVVINSNKEIDKLNLVVNDVQLPTLGFDEVNKLNAPTAFDKKIAMIKENR